MGHSGLTSRLFFRLKVVYHMVILCQAVDAVFRDINVSAPRVIIASHYGKRVGAAE